ncbi:MAG: VCBS repeat-containing protein, partial [Candidatus Azotimanducaceae bacterium]
MTKKIRFQVLEPRIMLDAAGMVTAVETSSDHQKTDFQQMLDATFVQNEPEQPVDGSEASPNSTFELEEAVASALLGQIESTALVVVDTSIDGYEQLLADVELGVEVLLIDGEHEGLQQLSDYVADRDDITSIHILSHGDEGELRLGTTTINNENLNEYAEAFEQIGASLTQDGDLFLYGCNVAEGGAGIDFVSRLAEITDADIAASTDLTGDAAQGGNWDLEHTVGNIDGANLELTSFKGLLFAPEPLTFNNLVLTSGDGQSAGSIWIDTDVGTFGGQTVEAQITLTEVKSTLGSTPDDLPTLIDIDYAPLEPDSWNPRLREPVNGNASGGDYEVSFVFDVEFFISGTDTVLVLDTYLTPFDIDGSPGDSLTGEFVSVTAPVVSVVLDGGTPGTKLDFDITYDGADTTVLLTTDASVSNSGINDNEPWLAQFQVVQADKFTIELGVAVESGGNWITNQDRVSSILFNEATFTTPNTISLPIIDLDGDNSGTATERDYLVGPYFNGEAAVPIADSDVTITDTDPNSVTMNSATIALTNAMTGDELNVGTLPAGITATGGGSSSIQLSGVASIADYQAAIQAIEFSNDNAIIDGTDRTIQVQVFNGDVLSPIATTTIKMFGTPTVDSLTTSDQQPTVTGTYDSSSATELSVTVNGIAYTLSDPELTSVGDVWSLDLNGLQTLPFGTYNIEVDSSDGTSDVSDTTISELRVISSPEWSIVGASNAEEGGSAQYTVSLEGSEALAASDTVSVVVNLVDVDTAPADFDATLDSLLTTIASGRADLSYNSASNSLTFTSSGGDAMADVTIVLPITDDATVEPDEEFNLTLSAPNNSSLTAENSVSTIVTDANELPEIASLTADSPTFTEGDVSPAGIFSGASVDTIESNQTVEQIQFTVDNLSDGALEVVNVDGTQVSLVNTPSGTTSSNGYEYSVSVVGGVATVTVTTTGSTELQAETLLNGLSYQNNSVDKPTAGDRDVTVTSITDSGSDNNVRTTGLPGASTVTVEDVNDAPVVSPPPLSLAYTGPSISIDGAGFSVDDVDYGAAFTATATLTVTEGTISITPGSSGVTIDSGDGTQTVVISGTMSEIDSLLRGDSSGAVDYTSTSTSNDTLTVLVSDGGGTGGAAESGSNLLTITKAAPGNTAPVIDTLNGDTLNYAEGDSVQILDQGTAAQVTDVDEVFATGDFEGGRLIITPAGNLTAEDRFGIDESGDINVTPSGLVQYLGTTIGNSFGTFSATTGGYVSLNADASPEAVTALMQAITYENIAGADPTAGARTVAFSVEDGDGGTSNVAVVSINVSVTADPPAIDLDTNNSSGATGANFVNVFDQGTGSPVSIADTADVSVIDPEGNDISTLTIVAADIKDGISELLDFNGTLITLEASDTQTNIAVGGVNIDVVYTSGFEGGLFAITANGGGDLSTAEVQAILADIDYDNASGSPTVSPSRVFTVTAQDTTGQTSPSATSTISINAAPVVSLDVDDSEGNAPDYNVTFAENGAAVNITHSDASVIDDNVGDVVVLTIAASNIQDGASEILSFSGTDFVLDASNQAFGDITVGGVTVDVVYNGSTQTFTVTDSDGVSGLSPADAISVLQGITYSDISDTPNDTATRILTIIANDGTASSTAVTSNISVTAFNDAPIINDLNGRNTTYIISSGASVIDASSVANVIDPEENFDTAPTPSTLTVSFSAGATGNDTLSIRNEGAAAGQIDVVGSDVRFGSVIIGTVAGGASGGDLVISFNASADSAAIGALLNNISFDYSNTLTGSRTVDFTLVDDENASSNIASLDIIIGNDVVAANDNYDIDAGDGSISAAAPGILDNDSNIVTPGATLNFDASTNGGGTATWSDDTGLAGFDWTFTNVTHNSSPTTSLPGITESYTFGATSAATTTNFGSIAGDPNDADASFELWFKPDDLVGDEMLFETGGGSNGFAIYLEDNLLYVSARSTAVDVSTDIAGLEGDFIQVVGVVDLTNDLLNLYVNGSLAASLTFTGGDWDDGNDAGLGSVNGTSGAQNGGSYDSFQGEIAKLRFYESALSTSEVLENYNVISQSGTGLTVFQVNAETNEANDVTGTYGDIDWATDGSFVYNLDNANQDVIDLQLGSTLTDTFTYTVVDSTSNSDTATITITINGTNDSPVLDLDANNSSGAIGADYASPFILGADTNVDIVDTGDITLTDVNDLTFPLFTITVGGLQDIGVNEETLTVGGVTFDLNTNDPTTNVTVGGVVYDVTYTSGVLTVSKDGGAFVSAAEVTEFLKGTQYANNDLATPTVGDRTFAVVVSDGDDDSAVATATISVVNDDLDDPIANDDTFSVDEGATDNLDLIGTGGGGQDSDGAGSGILLSSIIIQSDPLNGTITSINADGTVDYEHDGSESATDTFTYTIKDKVGNESAPATVTIYVNPLNDPPFINDLDGDEVRYGLGTGAQIIDAGVSANVTDVDSADFNTGTLTVAYPVSGATTETLGVNDQGAGVGNISLSGSDVQYDFGAGPVTIGAIDGTNDGLAGATLDITFNGLATQAAVDALVQNITYANSTTVGGFASALTFTITDGDGGTSNASSVSIQNELAAADDAQSTDEDTILDRDDTVSVGVLGNDANAVTSGALLSFDPANNAGADPWPNDAGTGTSQFDLLGTSTSNFNYLTGSSSLPGITSSFEFLADGTSDIAFSGASITSLDSFGQSEADATLEVWIKPDSLSGGNQVLFETGGSTDGLAITLDGSTLVLDVRDDNAQFGAASFDISTLDITDFIQVIASVDLVNNQINLYAVDSNGLALSATGIAFAGTDWTGNEAGGLGTLDGASAIVAATPVDFAGEIALFRYYDSVLTASERTENYEAIAQPDLGLTVTMVTDDDGDPISLGSGFTTDLGATFTINSDGTYLYDPIGADLLQDLASGDSETETFSYTVTDNLGNTDTAELVITTTGIDDAPTFTSTTTLSPTFTEGDATATDLFTAITIDAIEPGQTIEALVFTVTNVTDGSTAGDDEFINIDGTQVALNDTNSGTTSGSTFGYSVSLNPTGTATVTLTTAGASVGAIQTLVDELSYENSAEDLTEATRAIAFTSIQDSGSGLNPADENTALVSLPTSSVAVVGVDDAPVVTATVNPSNFIEDGVVASGLFTSVSVDPIEASQTFNEIVITVTGVDDPGNEELSIDGFNFGLNDQLTTTNTSTTSALVSLAVNNVGAISTVTLDVTGATAAEVEALIESITYEHVSVELGGSGGPIEGDRLIAVTSITDSGVNTVLNENQTVSPSLDLPTAALVSVVDRPWLDISADDLTLSDGETTTLTFIFSEEVSNFDVSDISFSSGTLGPLSTTDNITFTVAFTPDDDFEGTATITVANDVFDDAAGIASGDGDFLDITVDTGAPTFAAQTHAYVENQVADATVATLTSSDNVGVTSFVFADGG